MTIDEVRRRARRAYSSSSLERNGSAAFEERCMSYYCLGGSSKTFALGVDDDLHDLGLPNPIGPVWTILRSEVQAGLKFLDDPGESRVTPVGRNPLLLTLHVRLLSLEEEVGRRWGIGVVGQIPAERLEVVLEEVQHFLPGGDDELPFLQRLREDVGASLRGDSRKR